MTMAQAGHGMPVGRGAGRAGGWFGGRVVGADGAVRAAGSLVRVAGVPALLWCREAPEVAARRGTVLFYHGFGGTKEKLGAYLSALAEAGFLAVSLDAVGHGERRYPD